MKQIHLAAMVITLVLAVTGCTKTNQDARTIESFNEDWSFRLADDTSFSAVEYDDSDWRRLNLPHDWSIEGEFSEKNPATPGGGALPGGIGWYRKVFILPESDSVKKIFLDFDGVYRNSRVYVNNRLVGERPYGYSSFRYEITSFLNFGGKKNVIAVRVDNSQQPNSRWYSGSGIYRNVWLVRTGKVFIDHWGTFITTPVAEEDSARMVLLSKVRNASMQEKNITVATCIGDSAGKCIATVKSEIVIPGNSVQEVRQEVPLVSPNLWTLERPYLYKAITTIYSGKKQTDRYETSFGIRSFYFDSLKGFFLNGKHIKIRGVCNHHDLGCLGAAINVRAIERQLEMLKEMGCNAIRTSHNPPAPELLDLCDRMGFIVMDEAFDMWEKKKTPFDYALNWNEWHERDLRDMVLRDRNHPSVFIWSIGNEVIEQWDTSGLRVAPPLARIVRELDLTRPVTSACNAVGPKSSVIMSGALDILGYNYAHQEYEKFPEVFPGKIFIATETTSTLMTRGYYDMPSDSIRRWPVRWDIPFTTGNPDNTVSAYDNVSAPWGSTHEETWKVIKKHDFLSGMFIWTGFDYLGEPTPYGWPSRSSYFGIIDLAGFPKDVYYLYQSEWTDKPVLYLYPHWNWKENQLVDVIAYTNFSEAELFLNDSSLGVRKKGPDDLHLMWRLNFKPGTLKVVGHTDGQPDMIKTISTAGTPVRLKLTADRSILHADGRDLSFITVDITDKDGNLVPDAGNLVKFRLSGEASIAGVDNGDPVSHESFKADFRKAFHGKCLVVIQSKKSRGRVTLTADSEGLESAVLSLQIK